MSSMLNVAALSFANGRAAELINLSSPAILCDDIFSGPLLPFAASNSRAQMTMTASQTVHAPLSGPKQPRLRAIAHKSLCCRMALQTRLPSRSRALRGRLAGTTLADPRSVVYKNLLLRLICPTYLTSPCTCLASCCASGGGHGAD